MQINSGKEFNDVFIKRKEEIKVQIKIPSWLDNSLRRLVFWINEENEFNFTL